MSYLSLSDKDKKEMLARTGAASIGDLFCCIPEAIRLKKDLALPAGQSEIELVRTIEAIGRRRSL
jgi:glycine dehydrogenase subunit 1